MNEQSWLPPIELTDFEVRWSKPKTRVRKFAIFLRKIRHQLFDETFQRQLLEARNSKPRGVHPKHPAQMTMLVLLQAYDGCSDEEAVYRTVDDIKYRIVLDMLEATEPLCSASTLCEFRKFLLEHELDTALLKKTIHLAEQSKLFSTRSLKKLQMAVDTAPLEGTGKVLDTINLLGKALLLLVTSVASLMQVPREHVIEQANLALLQEKSVKAGLDIDWNQPFARDLALSKTVQTILKFNQWLIANKLFGHPALQQEQDVLERIYRQDVVMKMEETPWEHKQGVSPDRLISLTDKDMRHGRKSSSKTINGFKKVLAAEKNTGIILAATVIPANVPDSEGLNKLSEQESWLPENIGEIQVDHAFITSVLVQQLIQTRPSAVIVKPAKMRKTETYNKKDFHFDWNTKQVTCPAGQKQPILLLGAPLRFSQQQCQNCNQKGACLPKGSRKSKVISLHPYEPFYQDLGARMETKEGRTKTRERTVIEHRIAHHTAKQKHRARYWGTRKNEFDTRRYSTILNLETILRSTQPQNLLSA